MLECIMKLKILIEFTFYKPNNEWKQCGIGFPWDRKRFQALQIQILKARESIIEVVHSLTHSFKCFFRI